MKKLALYLLCLFTFSCGDMDTKYPDPYQGTGKEKYISGFEKVFDVEVKYPVKYGSLKNSGVCSHVTSLDVPDKKVIISRQFWNIAMENEKNWLIYHELGHCSFGLSHDKRTFENGEPKSIMHPGKIPSFKFFYDNKTYYIEEMKRKANGYN